MTDPVKFLEKTVMKPVGSASGVRVLTLGGDVGSVANSANVKEEGEC